GNVQRLIVFQLGDVDLDELRQVFRQAGDFDLGHDVRDDLATELHGRADFTVGEVQRHLDVQFLARVDALEVDVQHELLERVPLGVTQDDGLFLAIQDNVEDGSVEGFLAQQVIQLVMVKRDRL